jgi:hypothetical protein
MHYIIILEVFIFQLLTTIKPEQFLGGGDEITLILVTVDETQI